MPLLMELEGGMCKTVLVLVETIEQYLLLMGLAGYA